ncbi:MAG: hypothetical protein Q7S63_02345, partial [bacterium]|nr:hypothetical protein [bacterium]
DLLLTFSLILMEIGLLYRKNKIDREMVYEHFHRILTNIFEEKELDGTKSLMEFIEGNVEHKDISMLYRQLNKKWRRQGRIVLFGRRIKRFFTKFI